MPRRTRWKWTGTPTRCREAQKTWDRFLFQMAGRARFPIAGQTGTEHPEAGRRRKHVGLRGPRLLDRPAKLMGEMRPPDGGRWAVPIGAHVQEYVVEAVAWRRTRMGRRRQLAKQICALWTVPARRADAGDGAGKIAHCWTGVLTVSQDGTFGRSCCRPWAAIRIILTSKAQAGRGPTPRRDLWKRFAGQNQRPELNLLGRCPVRCAWRRRARDRGDYFFGAMNHGSALYYSSANFLRNARSRSRCLPQDLAGAVGRRKPTGQPHAWARPGITIYRRY